MAFPTTVNPQITDAVTQANVKVVGEAPAFAMGSIYQSVAHSAGILFQNASLHNSSKPLAQAANNQGVMQTYGVDTGACAADVENVAQGGAADTLNSLLTVLTSFDTAK